MSRPLHLRNARLQDSRELARVHVETWRHTYAGMVPDQYLTSLTIDGKAQAWRQWIGRQGRQESVLLVETQPEKDSPADRGRAGRLVGFGHAGPTRDKDLPFKGEVYTLYVDIDWQGQGIGRHLLGCLFRDLLTKGLDSALIWVLADNPSRFFYEAMGGQRIAERQDPFAGVLLDEIAYGWPDAAALKSLTPEI